MKTVSKICGFTASLSTIIVILVCFVLAVPCAFGFRPYTVLSGSMEPVIPVAALAYIDTKDTEPAVGQITAYRLETTGKDSFVVHRIIAEQDGMYITKGDNNEEEDLIMLDRENIIGAYKYCIPMAGYLFANKAVVLLFVFLWIMGWNLFSLLFEKISEI